jgi:HAMP domain-containing protein
MSNLLRVSVILLLVLGLVAAVLELGLFKQREELKARNQLLGKSVATLASYVESATGAVSDLAARDIPRLQVSEESLKQFYELDAAGKPTKTVRLEGVLNEIGGKAAIQYSRLNDTRSELTTTRDELGATKTTLKDTEDNLTAAKKENAEKANTIAAQTTTIDEQKGTITTLEEEKERNTAKIESQTAEIAKLNETVTEREQAIEAQKRHIAKQDKELAMYRGRGDGGNTNAPPPGLQGQVLVVNSNWNFVVVDVNPEGQLVPLTDLTVMRESKLVGKLRVSEYLHERKFAIAEIIADMQQMPFATGDYVFY